MSERRRVMIESPLKGQVTRNRAYAKACMRDSFKRGEAPFAVHMLYAQPGILDDTIPEERALGIACGLAWAESAELVAIYTDLGVSSGMQVAIDRAAERSIPVEYRSGVWALDAICTVCFDSKELVVTTFEPCLYCFERHNQARETA